MKHVTCVIGSLSGGGAERQMLELLRILVEHNYRVTLVTITDNDNYRCIDGVKRIVVVHKNKYIKMYKLWKVLRTIECDCCISFLQRINFISCLATFPLKKWKLICSERNYSYKDTLFQEILFQLYRRSDYVVPNSRSQTSYLSRKSPWLKDKIVTITNYTDIIKNKPLYNYNPSKDVIKVGIFARFTQQKNPQYLVSVAAELKRKGLNYVFYWYGNYQVNRNDLSQVSPYYLRTNEQIKKEGLENSFHLCSFDSNTVERMNEMDIVSLSSLYEGYPNTLSEAMACGRAVIASNVSDIPDMIEEGINGFLFDVNDVGSGVNAFIKYYQLSIQKRIEMGIANRRKAEFLFNRKEFGEKYLKLIEL